MITLLTLGAIALGLIGARKQPVAGIGATKKAKRRVYQQMAELQQFAIPLGLKWADLSAEEQGRVKYCATANGFTGSSRSTKSVPEQYYNSISRAYNAISGIGYTDNTLFDIAAYIADMEAGSEKHMQIVLKEYNSAISDMENGLSLYDANVGVYDLITDYILSYCEENGIDRAQYLKDSAIEAILYATRDNLYNALEELRDEYSGGDWMHVYGIGETDLPHTDYAIRNDRGDVILTYHDYGTDAQILHRALDWFYESFVGVPNVNGYYATAWYIAAGRKLNWQSVKQECFATTTNANAERKARISYLAKDGATVLALAHDLWQHSGGERTDMELRDEIISALLSIQSAGQAQQYVLDAYYDAHQKQDAYNDLPF